MHTLRSTYGVHWRICLSIAISSIAATTACTSFIGGKAEIRDNRKFIIESAPLSMTLPNSERPYTIHLELNKFDVSRLYDRNQIVIRESPEEIREERYHSWAVRPSEMITDAVEGYLKDARLFADIRQDFIDTSPDYSLTGTVKSLERLDSGDQWYANFKLSMQLVNNRNEIVKSWDFSDEAERVYNRDFVHTVSTFKEMLRRYMTQVIRDLDFMFLVRKMQLENRPYEHLLDAATGGGNEVSDSAVIDTLQQLSHPDYEIIPGKGR